MKLIKSFRVFESGLPYSYSADMQIAINNLLLEERFQPHINQINPWTGNMRKFNVSVVANQSKWGIQYEVHFRLDQLRLDQPVHISLVNDQIKGCWRDIMEIVMDKSKSQGQVKLTKFNYFGDSAQGRKDGHTGEVQDVTARLEDVIELDEVGPKPDSNCPIMLQFTVVN